MKITGRLQTFDRATGARLSNKKVDLTKKNRIPRTRDRPTHLHDRRREGEVRELRSTRAAPRVGVRAV